MTAGRSMARQQRGPREARHRLHNMSAPPRATISFRLVTAHGAAQDAMPATGLRWVCRIDLPAVFWPLPEGVGRDAAQHLILQESLAPQRRLLAQALAEEDGHAQPAPELSAQADAMPAEAVLESLRDLALRTDPAALGLPAFGLLRPVRGTQPRPCTGRMRLAVAVLARRRGGVFLRQVDPLPPAYVIEALDLWTPVPAADQGEPQ